jgi:hypothetical protein
VIEIKFEDMNPGKLSKVVDVLQKEEEIKEIFWHK